MNILPKKRWHVRTKENIARVRKDEAEAAEKERQERIRIENADREARLNILKQKSKERLSEAGVPEPVEEYKPVNTVTEHINLFADYDHTIKITNKEHDKEVKDKNEEYEKKIGYLTYLGQDTNEALKKKNWYEVAPEAARFSRSDNIKVTYDKLVLKDADGKPRKKELDEKDGEIAWKAKQKLDPINAFRKYCHEKHTKLSNNNLESTQSKLEEPTKCTQDYISIIGNTEKHKSKTQNKIHKKEKAMEEKLRKLQKLREARLKREKQEKYKTDMFLSGLNGNATAKSTEEKDKKLQPKYNSQFNPELARQNYR